MTQMQPRVSAIITAYNSASYIGGAIESIMAQTRPADEIIIIDDGSTDETAAIIDSYSSQGVRRVTQKNQGPSAARNRGVAESRGELIAFLDADDLWLPEKLAEQTNYLATHPNAVLVSCNRWRWILPEDRRRLERYGPSHGKNARSEVLIQNIVGNPSMVLLQRTALDKAGLFNLTMRWAEDWELWTRIAREGDLGFVEKPLIVYRSHSSSLSYEKEALHFPIQFAIARQAITSQRPLYNQPLDLARARSVVETQRAFYAVNRGLPRIQQVWYALCAFASYPFERTGQKLGLIFRAIVGDSIYRRVQKKQQTPVSPPTL